MLIILSLYVALVWLIFSKLKLVKWGWGSGSREGRGATG